MTATSPLDRLAEVHRIEPDYVDIWGRRHVIGDDTKRALLAAMGVAAGSDAEIENSLNTAIAQSCERLAPAARIVTAGEPVIVPIAVRSTDAGPLAWIFRQEDGAETAGEASLADLDMLQRVDLRGEVRHRLALPLPLTPAPGYHRLTVAKGDREAVETDIIVTPKRAFWPACLDRAGGLTGLTAPLYGLRSERNAGIGDFSDLAQLAAISRAAGADFIGINPVHALFPSQPSRISPYSPSSRRFLNTLLIALDRVPELQHSDEAKRLLGSAEGSLALDRLRGSDLVDYAGVAACKRAVLDALFASFCDLASSSPRRVAFEAFRRTGGETLEHQARFETIAEQQWARDTALTDWRDWPAGFRSPDGKDVQAFALRHADRVTFYAWLQWLADQQLEEAQASAKKSGMALGLYLDLAVGVAPDGAEAWSDRETLVEDVRIGAPPDDFNPDGQDWGLLPLSPTVLKDRAYRPFIHLLRQNMRHAGALRIDHVLGLARSYWQPKDKSAPGAYIRYPQDDLLGIAALESQRQRCVVIGEDLGTVPTQLRTALDQRGLLGCRLLYFEREEDGAFKSAASYPQACIASTGTHDLPTLHGFWQGRDIDLREGLGLITSREHGAEERDARNRTRRALLQRLAEEGMLPEGIDPEQPPAHLPPSLLLAFHRFLRRTPAALNAVQLEDVVGAVDQANLPGTVNEAPNWQRKISVRLEQLGQTPMLRPLLQSTIET